MRHFFHSCFGAFLLLWGRVAYGEVTAWIPEMRALAAEHEVLQAQLSTIPSAPEVQLTQRLGWHSDYSSSPDKAEWVELNMGQAQKIDSVVLIAPPPNGGSVSTGYGFPLRFYVELLGEGEDNERTIIIDHTSADFPNPGLLPVVIPADGRMAQKVRITATRLYASGGRCFCALGEVMLLQGKQNLGARLEAIGPAAVRASSSQGTRPDWGRINLVDGHTVLGPPLGTRQSPTLGFRSIPTSEGRPYRNPWVELDLGQVRPIDEIRFFPAHPPQFAHSHGYGFPVRYQLELREEDNDEPRILPAPQSGSYNALPGDNVVTLVGAHRARFIRLQVLDPHVSNGAVVLAMAEMQVLSEGKNIAIGCDVNSPDSTEADGWSRAALVDGFASGADIVDWPGWLTALSQRRETFQALAVLDARQSKLRADYIAVAGWLLGGLLLAVLVALVTAYARQRKTRRLELEALHQRISQDLHDEIGSSLGSIMLITDDALALAHDDDLRHELGEIRDTAGQTLDSMRDIVRLAQTGTYGRGDLVAHLREITERMLRGITHTLNATDEVTASLPPMDQRRDLVLMFKEVLHNLTRHAQATTVEINLTQSPQSLTLLVHDNGRGFTPALVSGTGMGLTNLHRRAAKHGGSLEITSSPGHGTTIRITLPRHA